MSTCFELKRQRKTNVSSIQHWDENLNELLCFQLLRILSQKCKKTNCLRKLVNLFLSLFKAPFPFILEIFCFCIIKHILNVFKEQCSVDLVNIEEAEMQGQWLPEASAYEKPGDQGNSIWLMLYKCKICCVNNKNLCFYEYYIMSVMS